MLLKFIRNRTNIRMILLTLAIHIYIYINIHFIKTYPTRMRHSEKSRSKERSMK